MQEKIPHKIVPEEPVLSNHRGLRPPSFNFINMDKSIELIKNTHDIVTLTNQEAYINDLLKKVIEQNKECLINIAQTKWGIKPGDRVEIELPDHYDHGKGVWVNAFTKIKINRFYSYRSNILNISYHKINKDGRPSVKQYSHTIIDVLTDDSGRFKSIDFTNIKTV